MTTERTIVRRPGNEVFAARIPASESHVSGSLAFGAELHLRVMDCRTGEPVQGAIAKSIQITVDGHSDAEPWVPENLSRVLLRYPPPPYVPAFGQAQEKALEKAVDEVESSISDLDDAEDRIEKLLEQMDSKGKEVRAREDALAREGGAQGSSRRPPGRRRGTTRDSELARLLGELKALRSEHRKAEAGRRSAGNQLKRALRSRDRLVERRRGRREWVSYLQEYLAVHGRYDGPVDGVMTPDFGKLLAEEYKRLFGKTYSVRRGCHKVVTRQFYDHVKGRYSTREDGVLRVSLPILKKGRVRIEFAHFKVIEPEHMDEFAGRSDGRRVDYDSSLGRDADLPTDERPRHSGWKLVQGKSQRHFQNFLNVDFDTSATEFLVSPTPPPIEMETYALVWCQPVWTEIVEEPGGTRRGIKPGEWVDEDGAANLEDGRGLKDGHPTFFVSASKTRHGRRYGEWGMDGRRQPGPSFALKVRYGGEWYTWTSTFQPEYRFPDQDSAARWIFQKHEAAHERWSRRIYKVEQGQGQQTFLFGAIQRLPNADQWVVVRVRDYTRHASEAEADAELANRYGAGAARRPRMVKKVTNDAGEVEWYVLRPRERAGHSLYRSGPFHSMSEVKDNLMRKTHHGIDCAGNVGDHVYAACGGTISAVKDQHGGGGRYCNLSTWLHDSVSMMQFLHNEEVLVGKGAIVKAGDVIALMGRTGNPDKHSPTHMHFQCFHRGKLELIDPVVPQHEVVFPHNRLPKLIPCAADWGAGNSKATSNDDKAHGARHCAKRYSENSGNTTWKRCWAFEMGKCPYANGVIGVEAEEAPCPCEPPTENYPYADETFTVIEQMRQPIIDWAMRYNVRPLVVAGSIADEYNSRLTTMGGYKGTIDDIQDWLIQKSGQTVMDLSDEYLDSKAGRMTRWDIGKGNINVRTAWEMYQRYRGDFPSGDWTIHDVARYVLTDNGTAHVAACYIKYAEERIGDATASCDVKTTEAVQVTYYKQGPNYLRRYEQSCATVERDRAENPALPRHQIRPGEGCRVCRQRDRLLKALWGNFPPRQ